MKKKQGIEVNDSRVTRPKYDLFFVKLRILSRKIMDVVLGAAKKPDFTRFLTEDLRWAK